MRYIVLLTQLLIYVNLIDAQTDTIYIVKTDTVFATVRQDRLYRFFVENRGTETNHLWKINLAEIGVVKANIGYEHRLGKAWSVEGYLSIGSNGYLEFGQYKTPASFEAEQLFKYYYNLNRRARLGKKTNGFSGNYIATSLCYTNDRIQVDINNMSRTQVVNSYNIGLKYGLQRRIGNFGYIDLFAGVYYRYQSIHYRGSFVDELPKEYNHKIIPLIGLKIGFAIDSFDNFRRMLKD